MCAPGARLPGVLCTMVDFRPLLRRGIAALPENSGAGRRNIYQKARDALVSQLRAVQPPLSAAEITRHRMTLEDCIRDVEQEASEAVIRSLAPTLYPPPRVEAVDEPPRPIPTPLSDIVREDLVRRGLLKAELKPVQDGFAPQAEPNSNGGAAADVSEQDVSPIDPDQSSGSIEPNIEKKDSAISPPETAAAPSQQKTVTVFKIDGNGISVGPHQILEVLSDGPDQKEAYDSLRREVSSLLLGSSNLLGDAASSLRSLSEALPAEMSEARVFRLWRAGNKVRRLYRAHTLVVDLPDGHPSAIDPAVAEFVGAICDEFNNLAAVDPGLKQRDLWRVPPQQVAAATNEFQGANVLIDIAVQANIVSPDAIAEVAPDGLVGPSGAPADVLVPEIDLVNQVRRNFFAALIGGAFEAAKKYASMGMREVSHARRMIADGVYTHIGTGVGIALIGLVVLNIARIRIYAETVLRSPEAVAAIDWIMKLFGGTSPF